MNSIRLWRNGVRIRARVISALMIRDAMSRFGHENLGFFWVIGEPLAFSVGIMALWTILHMSHGEGVEVIPFALTGYTFITMWRHITGRAMGSIKHHNSISYHRHVEVIDAVVSMALLEVLACFSAFIVAYLPLWGLGYCPTISDPFALVSGFALSGLFSIGVGLFLAGLCQLNPILHHVIPAGMYLSMPLTGIFTMQSWLPERIRNVLLWSPLVDGIEMFRGGLFPSDIETYWTAPYLLISAVLTAILGYYVFRKTENIDNH